MTDPYYATVGLLKKSKTPLTDEQISEIVSRITYKPGSSICYYNKRLTGRIPISHGNSVTGSDEAVDVIIMTDVPLPNIYSEEELLMTVRSLFHRAEMHEADEWLRYDSKVLYNPHDINTMDMTMNYPTRDLGLTESKIGASPVKKQPWLKLW